MTFEIIKYFLIGLIACVIAALPLGLVNLSVIDTVLNQNKKSGRAISFGAAIIEILFVSISLFFGSKVKDFFVENFYVSLFILVILISSAFYFYFRKQKLKIVNNSNSHYFSKGLLLNAISLQVLSFWLIAVLYFYTEKWIELNTYNIIIFIAGVFTGKLITLEFYIYLAIRAKDRLRFLPDYTNKFMSMIFVGLSFIQIMRIIF